MRVGAGDSGVCRGGLMMTIKVLVTGEEEVGEGIGVRPWRVCVEVVVVVLKAEGLMSMSLTGKALGSGRRMGMGRRG